MGKYIPVDPDKWAAMVQAQAENKRLKEHLNSVTETHRINTSMWKDDLVRYKEMCDELDAECTRLKAEVERLTKAGDAMAEEIALAKRQDEGSRFDPIEMHYDHELIVNWNAAKEGKQP
jgi:hypothetical protein